MENEKRLIDYEKARKIVLDILQGKVTTVTAVKLATLLKGATVDAVEVVRCKDCMHYINLLENESDYRCSIFCGCYDRPYPTVADDFCSYGERREEE